MSKTKLTRRLDSLEHSDTANQPRRYKLPESVADAIDKAGKVYGQKSRAIQVGVEILWRSPGPLKLLHDDGDSPLVGRSYKLAPRTISQIETLGRQHALTQAQVLAAAAQVLSEPDPAHRIKK
jgi:hypothetical protein